MSAAKRDWERIRTQYVHGIVTSDSALMWPTLEMLAASHDIPVSTMRRHSSNAVPSWSVQREEAQAETARERAAAARARALEVSGELDARALEAATVMMDVIAARTVRLHKIHSEADGKPPKSPAVEMSALTLAFARAYEIGRVARGDVNREGAWWSEVLIRRHRRQLRERMERMLAEETAARAQDSVPPGELGPGDE